MEHFRDITGYQAIGRVLSKKATSNKDVIDFLNFLSQIVFCSQVKVSDLGPDDITKKTHETRKLLIKYGVPEDFLTFYKYSEGKKQIEDRNRISQEILNDWQSNGFPELEEIAEHKFPPSYYPMLKDTVDILEDVLVVSSVGSYSEPSKYAIEVDESLKDKKYSYLIGLLLSNENLVCFIRDQFKRNTPTRKMLYDFISKTRNKLNTYLSENENLIFTPSYSRSFANYDANKKLRNKILTLQDPESEFNKLGILTENFESKIPSAIHVFLCSINKNKQEPESLIKIALDLRMLLSNYRSSYLDTFNSTKFSGTEIEKVKYSEELEYVYDDVFNEIKKRCDYNSSVKVTPIDMGKFSYDFSEYSVDLDRQFNSTFDRLYTSFVQRKRAKQVVHVLTQELTHLIHSDYQVYAKLINDLYFKFSVNA